MSSVIAHFDRFFAQSALSLLCFCVWGDLAYAESAAASAGWQIGTGSAVYFNELELHVDGNPMSVYEIVYSLHPMDDSATFEPSGLWVYHYVEVGHTGQAKVCRRWFEQVAQDQKQDIRSPYPYLEVNTRLGTRLLVADEGKQITPDGGFNCYEIFDFR